MAVVPLLLLLLSRRVMSVDPPKHPSFFTGTGVLLLPEVSIVLDLDLDLADDDVAVLSSKVAELFLPVGSLPRDLDLVE